MEEVNVVIQVDAERWCAAYFEHQLTDTSNRTILAVTFQDSTSDRIGYTVRQNNSDNFLREQPEIIDYMQVSTENYVHLLEQGENITLTILNQYDPYDIFSSKNYINTMSFRLLRIEGPKYKDVAECVKDTMAIQDAYTTKLNYYCYDPLTIKYICETVRNGVDDDRRALQQQDQEYSFY